MGYKGFESGGVEVVAGGREGGGGGLMPFLPVELETASQAPRSAQTGPCQVFLWSGVQLSSPSSPLISASHTAIWWVFF